jgi:hypothetical protein
VHPTGGPSSLEAFSALPLVDVALSCLMSLELLLILLVVLLVGIAFGWSARRR